MCLLNFNINLTELILGREITDDVVNFITTQKLYDRRMESEKFWRKEHGLWWSMNFSHGRSFSQNSLRRDETPSMCLLCLRIFHPRDMETFRPEVELPSRFVNFWLPSRNHSELLGISGLAQLKPKALVRTIENFSPLPMQNQNFLRLHKPRALRLCWFCDRPWCRKSTETFSTRCQEREPFCHKVLLRC